MEAHTNGVKVVRQSYWDLAEEEEEKAISYAFSVLSDTVRPAVLKAVMDLDVFEIIRESGPGAHLSVAEIVARLPTENPEAGPTLSRLLNFLAIHSFLTIADGATKERRYGLAPVCKFFTPNDDGVSLSAFTNRVHRNIKSDKSLYLRNVVLDVIHPFKKLYGDDFYKYINETPEQQNTFHTAMSHHSTLIMKKILKIYNGFEGVSLLVDVGGGSGASINMIYSQHPTIKAINFDQPHVTATAPSYSGVEHVGGDMFAKVPKGDAMFLKWILHNFDDEACIKILKNCYTALPENQGKVIVCEYIYPNVNETTNNIAAHTVAYFDILMMLNHPGGKERTEMEFKALAMTAGFQGFKVVCSAYNISIMELVK